MTTNFAPDRGECPKCRSVAKLLSPLKKTPGDMAVYGCFACGFTFSSDGRQYVEGSEVLSGFVKGAAEGADAMAAAMGQSNINPAAFVILQAQMVEYGTERWFDGLKQGLLLGARAAQRGSVSGEVQPGQPDSQGKPD